MCQSYNISTFMPHIEAFAHTYNLDDLQAVVNNTLFQLLAGSAALVVCVHCILSTRKPEHIYRAYLPRAARKRSGSSVYPPGMQFDVVQKKWARQGMVPPFPTGEPVA